MSRPVGFAVIGSGYWGINYVRVLSELTETRLVAVCDTFQDRLDEVARRYEGVMTTPNLDDILQNDAIQAAVVCTPSSTHFEVASRLIEAGKSVLIEKPMTIRSDHAQTLAEMAAAHGAKLMVGHIFLFNSGVQKVKTCVESGDIGELYYLYARRTNLGPIRRDVNVMWDLATHDVSIFNYMLGDAPEWVSAVGSSVLHSGLEDVAFAALHYASGVTGHIHVSWADPNKEREVVVVGSRQRIAFNDLSAQDRVRIFEKGVAALHNESSSFGEYQLSMRDGDIISPNVPVREPLKAQTQHFVDCIVNDRQPLSDGRNGYDVVRTMEAINESMKRNGVPVRLDSLQSLQTSHVEERAF